jgi:hypothetical protein
MPPNKLRMAAILILAAGIAAATIVMQHQSVRRLHEENLAKGSQLQQVTEEAQSLSNQLLQANSAQHPREKPLPELLRLRGEVGVLRLELQELRQSIMAQRAKGASDPRAERALSTEDMAKIEDIRVRGKPICERLKAVLDQLQSAPDRETLLQAILTNGIRDDLLASLLQQRQLAPQDSGIVDLNRKIQSRSEGIRVGLSARLSSIQISLEHLTEIGETGAEAMSAVERLLRETEGLITPP